MDKIEDILEYEYTKTGGYLTVKFESGWITKRKFCNIQFNGRQICALDGKVQKEHQTGIHFSIKKRGYSSYNLSQININKFLTGEGLEVENESDIQKALRIYMNSLRKDVALLKEEDLHLRGALAAIKFKRSKVGKKLSTSYRLLELVTET